jgi:hypothetical protein
MMNKGEGGRWKGENAQSELPPKGGTTNCKADTNDGGDFLFLHFPFFLDLVYERYICTLVIKCEYSRGGGPIARKIFGIFDFRS